MTINSDMKEPQPYNSEAYSELLSQYQPRVIKTEEENEKFLAVVEDLLSRSHLTPEENMLLELLVRLIENFEDQHYQLNYEIQPTNG